MPKRTATCHPDRPHLAKGFCKNCYYQANRNRALSASKRRYLVNRGKILARGKLYRKANPDKHRNAQLKRLYGISLVEYEKMRSDQGDLCKFCSESLNKTAVVDHNHSTGTVRGIIHQRCNIILGFFEMHGHLFTKIGPYLGIADWRAIAA